MATDLHDGLPPLLNVDNLANGALYERLQQALTEVATNILNPNTSEKQKRKIKIEICATPYPDRSGAQYTLSVSTTLAGIVPAEGNFYIGRRSGEVLVYARNQKQIHMNLDPPPADTPETKPRAN
jgi:hypothetical protein